MGVPFDITWPMVIAGAGIGALGWFGVDELALRHWRHETASAFGSASWAAKRDLEQTGLFGAEGVVLGRVGGRLLRHRMDRHLLTIASNRSGKGVSSIIPNLLTWPGSLVVIDPKGENAAVTARHRREMGQEVHILDPLGITGLRGSRFNPLLWLDPQGKNFVEDANLVADSLHMSQATKEEMFFSNESKAWVAGEIMHIVTTEPPATRTLATLRAHLTHPKDEFDWLLDDMTDNSAAFGLAARAASRLRQKADRERSGVISTAQAETHFLDSPSMTEVMAASDFDLGQLKRGAMTIYLVLPAERLATHGRWLRLMISLCIATLTRDRMPPRHPVLMVLDEFAASRAAAGDRNGDGAARRVRCPALADPSRPEPTAGPLSAPVALVSCQRRCRPGLRRQRCGDGGVSLVAARDAHRDRAARGPLDGWQTSWLRKLRSGLAPAADAARNLAPAGKPPACADPGEGADPGRAGSVLCRCGIRRSVRRESDARVLEYRSNSTKLMQRKIL